ncbi:hypothetical protein KFU94_20835 [Chloroflexi bacterium TSY]|nr:hypothetical protein [Chloroflexi bacterium TSY]MBV7330642.1 hypothetical protein [Chloroflexi bacterium TSY]
MPQPPEEAFDIWVNRTAETFEDVSPIEYFVDSQKIGTTVENGVTHREFFYKNKKVVETIPAFKVGKFFAYAAEPDKSTMKMPIKNHLGLITFESDGEGGTIVTMRQFYDKKFHPMALVVTWGMKYGVNDLLKTMATKHGGEQITTHFVA